jgi:hypothetical protein
MKEMNSFLDALNNRKRNLSTDASMISYQYRCGLSNFVSVSVQLLFSSRVPYLIAESAAGAGKLMTKLEAKMPAEAALPNSALSL